MGIQAVIDAVIQPHGNWQSLSPGWVMTLWLIHILTAHSHRMDRVQTWVAKRIQLLQQLDFTDDRLVLCLRIYPLSKNRAVRLDAMTGSVSHVPEQHTLFKGKAKDGSYATQFKLIPAILNLSMKIEQNAG